MYMVTALVYFLVAGQPIEAPVPFNAKTSYMSLGECQGYLQSEQFLADKAQLTARVMFQLRVRAALTEPTPEIPTVAITASCEEDHRV